MKKGTKIGLGVIGVLVIAGAIGNRNSNNGDESSDLSVDKSISAEETTTKTEEEKETEKPAEKTEKAEKAEEKSTDAPKAAEEKKQEDVAEKPVETAPPEPEISLGQKNALTSAKNYISVMDFSYEGLIQQLEFEQYSHEDAVYGADNCGADWDNEALGSAKSYIAMAGFSYDGLIEQLDMKNIPMIRLYLERKTAVLIGMLRRQKQRLLT